LAGRAPTAMPHEKFFAGKLAQKLQALSEQYPRRFPLYLSNNITRCKAGLGTAFTHLRASVMLVLMYNLTYVHHPFRLSHGRVDTAEVDRLLGLREAGDSCGLTCVKRGMQSGAFKKVPFKYKPSGEILDYTLLIREYTGRKMGSKGNKPDLSDTIETELAMPITRPVVFQVRGCPRKGLVDDRVRGWLQQRYEEGRSRHGFEPRLKLSRAKLNVVLHYRGGDVMFDKTYKYRLLPSSYYLNVLKTLLALLGEGARQKVSLHLFSEGEPSMFKDFTDAYPDMALHLGSDATVPSDVDHMAQADVFLMAKSQFSVLASILSKGLKFSHADSYVQHNSHGLTHKVPCTKTGQFNTSEFRAAWTSSGLDSRFGALRS